MTDAHEHLNYARSEWDRMALDKGANCAAWTSIADDDLGVARCLEPLLRGIPIERGWHVLEIGCGGGRLLLPVAKRVPDGAVIGYDISDEMIDGAEKHLAELGMMACGFVRGDGRTIPSQIAPIDFTYSVLTFQHNPLEVWRGLLAGAVEVARPSGWLRLQLRDNPEHASEPLSFPVTPEEATAAIEAAGWTRVEIHGRDDGWPTWFWVTARAPGFWRSPKTRRAARRCP